MKKALIIINKTSGMGKKARLEEALIRNLKSQNYEPVIKYTEPTGFENILAAHAASIDLIVAAGGDGTISELVSILGKHNINLPVAVIPAGTVNDFARANNIPLNPILAAKELDTTRTKTIDTIKINDTYAGYMVAFGNFMTSFAKVNSSVKNKVGRIAYLIKGIKTLIKLNPYRVSIKIDKLEMETDSVFTLVSKISSVGSVEKLLPEAKPDDGLLHILNIEPINIKDIVQLIYMAFTGNITNHRKVMYLTADQVEIQTSDLKEMNIDGDLYDYKDVKVTVVKDGLTLTENKNKNPV
ncbi:Diacylglycerol kinase [Jeotgalicoccus saudimassiliensis]|uniref:Diacylglycerol kinase n=1 Tax=Jeotgalicoccus saudimassiliensis TaxID=1461582 RepID=A0A078ME09_9STAP|nr:diacylglycerol kinase family protein [Jeotgalicoccus saudimassiliensis]CEA02986.1 Diacylglycerol kinase [Jeotgalicoccus saudimassiliensis]